MCHEESATASAMCQPGPPPLRSVEFPRGLPGLSDHDSLRVSQDNFSSDYAIALQHWGHRHGLACLRENPLRSLHWNDPNEVTLHSQGGWYDIDYDACVFLGARRKAQRLRHNISEFLSLPNTRCGHIHDPNEWSKSGSRYPTFEEAEYTPSLVFTIAVTVTAWATRVGLKVEAVPRLPPVCQSGDVRSLLQFEAKDLCFHLMDIMGLHLGLRPPGHSVRGLAARVCAADIFARAKSLPPDSVYIGQGHFSHRWKPSKWTSPFQVGRDCAGATHVIKYAQRIAGQPHLLQSLHELQGNNLVCDCPHNATEVCWCAWSGTRNHAIQVWIFNPTFYHHQDGLTWRLEPVWYGSTFVTYPRVCGSSFYLPAPGSALSGLPMAYD